MVPDGQREWTEGMDGGTDGRTDDAKTISLLTSLGDKNPASLMKIFFDNWKDKHFKQ